MKNVTLGDHNRGISVSQSVKGDTVCDIHSTVAVCATKFLKQQSSMSMFGYNRVHWICLLLHQNSDLSVRWFCFIGINGDIRLHDTMHLCIPMFVKGCTISY